MDTARSNNEPKLASTASTQKVFPLQICRGWEKLLNAQKKLK